MESTRLTLTDFIRGDTSEDRKLTVSRKVRKIEDHFRDSRLFPWVSDLIEVNRAIQTVLRVADDVLDELPRRMKAITPEGEIEWERTEKILAEHSVHADELEDLLAEIEMHLREGSYGTPGILKLCNRGGADVRVL